ncbi:hypothetical protein BT96DRAFT_835385, partial [Gymnopus androsaceus JB14]
MNVVADGLSRMWEGQEREVGDGSEWTVNEDWESDRGLVNDVFSVSEATNWEALQRRFENEPVFQEVVAALEVLESSVAESVKRRALHKAGKYMVENGKLWKVGGNDGVRERPRVECVMKKEAVDLAKAQHESGGHWGRDSVKLALMDRIWSPKLDESVIEGI